MNYKRRTHVFIGENAEGNKIAYIYEDISPGFKRMIKTIESCQNPYTEYRKNSVCRNDSAVRVNKRNKFLKSRLPNGRQSF